MAVLACLALAGCSDSSPIAQDSKGGGIETVALTGRVFLAGLPVPGATIKLRAGNYLADTSGAPSNRTAPSADFRESFDLTADAAGNFRIDSVGLGRYTLEFNNGAGQASFEPFHVDGSAESIRLDGILRPVAEVSGSIVLPPGTPGQAYVQVYGLDRVQRTDSAGRFKILGVPGGEYVFRALTSAPAVDPGNTGRITVMPGDTLAIGPVELGAFQREEYSTWAYSRKITFNTTSTGANIDAAVNNIPVLVRLRSANFDFRQSLSPGGADLRFSSESGKHLRHEIERWDTVAGEADVWVRIDSVPANSETGQFNVHCGKVGIRGWSNGSEVFDSGLGFRGVWHLGQSPADAAPQMDDASGNGNYATVQGSLASQDTIAGLIHKGLRWNGTDQYLYTAKQFTNPNVFTVSLWFKTTTRTGGKLVGFGQRRTARSSKYDRHVWMDDTGRLHFGLITLLTPRRHVISSTRSYNDDKWHMVTARLSPEGQFLYVDGMAVASDPAVTASQDFVGYWRIGYDNLVEWPPFPSTEYFQGTLDEIRISHAAATESSIRFSYENQRQDGQSLRFEAP